MRTRATTALHGLVGRARRAVIRRVRVLRRWAWGRLRRGTDDGAGRRGHGQLLLRARAAKSWARSSRPSSPRRVRPSPPRLEVTDRQHDRRRGGERRRLSARSRGLRRRVSFRPGALFAGQERRIWVTLRVPVTRMVGEPRTQLCPSALSVAPSSMLESGQRELPALRASDRPGGRVRQDEDDFYAGWTPMCGRSPSRRTSSASSSSERLQGDLQRGLPRAAHGANRRPSRPGRRR